MPTNEEMWSLLTTPIYIASPDGPWQTDPTPPAAGAQMRYIGVDSKAGPLWLVKYANPPSYGTIPAATANAWIETNQMKQLSKRTGATRDPVEEMGGGGMGLG